METIVCLGLTHPELYCIKDALCSICLSLLQSYLLFPYVLPLYSKRLFICCYFSWETNSLTIINTHTYTHPSWHMKRVGIRRVFVDMIPFLYSIPSNLRTLCTCLEHCFHTKCLTSYLLKCSFSHVIPASHFYSDNAFPSSHCCRLAVSRVPVWGVR